MLVDDTSQYLALRWSYMAEFWPVELAKAYGSHTYFLALLFPHKSLYAPLSFVVWLHTDDKT